MFGLNIGLTQLPPWLQKAYQQLLGRSIDLSNLPYNQFKYTGPTVAPHRSEELV